jgi:hypothetical protein
MTSLARLTFVSLAALAALPAPAQEIIVTRKDARARPGYPPPEPRPAVVLRRRADNVVQGLLLTDDTRLAEARLEELRHALAALDEAAQKSRDVRVALVAETADGVALVRPFDRQRALAAIENGARPDSAQVRILVKTAIVEGDRDLSQPVARIDAFLRGLTLAGRAQIEPIEEPALSLVRPEQYRGAVIGAIAADLKAVVEQLGAGYGGRLEGLERPIEWAQLDELELGLYLPYRLTVTR